MINGFTWRTFHYINDTIAFVLAIVLNTVLIFLILKKTTNEFKPYGRILLQTCVVDMFFSSITFLLKEAVEINDGKVAFIVTGFFEQVPHPTNFILTCMWVFAFMFSFWVSPIPFFYRYMLICREKTLSQRNFFLLYVIVASLALIYTAFSGIVFPPESYLNEAYVQMMSNNLWLDENGRPPVFVAGEITSIKVLANVVLASIVTIFCYSLIIVFNIKIMQKLIASKNLMSNKTHRLHNQLTYALIIQALSPLVLTALPIFAALGCVLLRITTVGLGLPIMSAMSWVSVINPICVMTSVGPYRQAILQVCKRFNKVQASTNPAMVNTKISSQTHNLVLVA